MAEAIIFDIDGTLLDSVDLHAAAWQEAFRKFGYEIGYDEIRSQIGKGGDQLLPVFLSKEEIDRMGEQLTEYRGQLFKERYLPRVKPFPRVRELFQHIEGNGQKIALASSARGDELQDFERIAEIDDLVHVETSSADAEKSKPHPDIFEAALARLGDDVTPDRVVVVGDSPHDAVAAKRAGLRTVGVLCGGFPAEELREAGCIAIYRDPAHLLERYEETPLARKR